MLNETFSLDKQESLSKQLEDHTALTISAESFYKEFGGNQIAVQQ